MRTLSMAALASALRMRRMAVVLSVALSAGCVAMNRSSGARSVEAVPLRAEGRVVRVHPEHGFVILDCYGLPKAGEDLTVWRDGRRVALVRALERRRPPFVVADILAGEPRRGDTARAERWVPSNTETEPDEEKQAR